jgi:hypothetical protein
MIASRPWLLLTHQLPARPSNARVRVWRRLQEVGAVAAGTSVYVLPHTDECRADFHCLRQDILSLGGEAAVFAAEPEDARDSRRLVAAFRRLREDDYRALNARARRLLPTRERHRRGTRSAGRRQTVQRLRDRFRQIERIDFFRARGRDSADAVIRTLERAFDQTSEAARRDAGSGLSTEYQNRCWITRPRPSIDRISSAWLIRRFIDPLATFAFAHKPADGDVPFDMPGIGFTHQDSMCTFETLVQAFSVRDPVVQRLARIVHDLDLKDARFGVPETGAIGHVIDGFRGLYADDHALLEQGISFFDAFAGSKTEVTR